MSMSDPDLLQRYVENGSQEAFAALVKRHLDLVYSAARRQVRSPQLAEEVAQSVFLDLSRQACTLQPGTPLAAWLYLVTRRTSIDVIRRESRRQAREQTAVAIAAMNTSPSAWTHVEPLLDEAMESLDATDRSAVLLRYFENQSLREVGQSLGTSEDAAQKRVSRAVDQLRLFFAKRGVAVTAAGLATDLSANTIQTAPSSLGASISTYVATSSTTLQLSVTQATKVIAMTVIKKALITTVLVAAIGSALYESYTISRQQSRIQSLQTTSEGLIKQVRQLRQQRDDAFKQMRIAQTGTVSTPAVATSKSFQSIEAWIARAEDLRVLLEAMPDKNIPELQLLSDEDWLVIAKDAKLETDEDVRKAFSALRDAAKTKFALILQTALKNYIKTNGDGLPADTSLFIPYFESPVDPAILQRYQIVQNTQLGGKWQLNEKSPVDEDYDTLHNIGPNGYGNKSVDRFSTAAERARDLFSKANNGQNPASPKDLLPYMDPADAQALQKKLEEVSP
jgi:RNA polymerase sigma factor (sigma-70 family)